MQGRLFLASHEAHQQGHVPGLNRLSFTQGLKLNEGMAQDIPRVCNDRHYRPICAPNNAQQIMAI